MKEFIEKLIEELDELIQFEENRDEDEDKDFYTDCEEAFDDGASAGRYQALMKVKRVVLHLAEEYINTSTGCNKALDSLHKKILGCKFAEEVTEAEIAALVKAKGISCGDCSRRKWYQIGYEDGKNNNGWIPCSERLPEEHGEYLVWWTDLTGNKYYEITEYSPGEGWIGAIPQAFGEYKVIAWMLLPEPFQKGE